MSTNHEIRFVAENTLGKLAKWLRILGFDTHYESGFPEIRAAAENRIRLTRSVQQSQRAKTEKVIFIRSDHYRDQLRQVIQEVGISASDIRPFSLCLRCNQPIRPMNKSDAFCKVPDFIWEIHTHFQFCPRCNRIFWPGSHTTQSMRWVNQLFN